MTIASLQLTKPPVRLDAYGQPCFEIQQDKGLFESEDCRLTNTAKLEGYTGVVTKMLIETACDEIQRAADRRPVDIIEVGGGTGYMFDLLVPVVRTYINVDPGERRLGPEDIRRLQHPQYQLLRCSGDDLPLPDASADVVFSIASLDHIPDAERVLAEICRVLRPRGTFVLILNNRRSWWKRLLARSAYLKRREAWIATQHYIQWSCADCELALRRVMTVRRLYTRTFCPFVPRMWRLLLPCTDAIVPLLMPRGGANIVAVGIKE
jgi:ubiquinone/menaquinone biosynthesis C-methylase UbiE